MSDKVLTHRSTSIQYGRWTSLRTFTLMQIRGRNMDIIHVTAWKSILAIKIGSLFFSRTNFIQLGATTTQMVYINQAEIALSGKHAHINYKSTKRTQQWSNNHMSLITNVQTRALNIVLLLAGQFIGKK